MSDLASLSGAASAATAAAGATVASPLRSARGGRRSGGGLRSPSSSRRLSLGEEDANNDSFHSFPDDEGDDSEDDGPASALRSARATGLAPSSALLAQIAAAAAVAAAAAAATAASPRNLNADVASATPASPSLASALQSPRPQPHPDQSALSPSSSSAAFPARLGRPLPGQVIDSNAYSVSALAASSAASSSAVAVAPVPALHGQPTLLSPLQPQRPLSLAAAAAVAGAASALSPASHSQLGPSTAHETPGPGPPLGLAVSTPMSNPRSPLMRPGLSPSSSFVSSGTLPLSGLGLDDHSALPDLGCQPLSPPTLALPAHVRAGSQQTESQEQAQPSPAAPSVSTSTSTTILPALSSHSFATSSPQALPRGHLQPLQLPDLAHQAQPFTPQHSLSRSPQAREDGPTRSLSPRALTLSPRFSDTASFFPRSPSSPPSSFFSQRGPVPGATLSPRLAPTQREVVATARREPRALVFGTLAYREEEEALPVRLRAAALATSASASVANSPTASAAAVARTLSPSTHSAGEHEDVQQQHRMDRSAPLDLAELGASIGPDSDDGATAAAATVPDPSPAPPTPAQAQPHPTPSLALQQLQQLLLSESSRATELESSLASLRSELRLAHTRLAEESLHRSSESAAAREQLASMEETVQAQELEADQWRAAASLAHESEARVRLEMEQLALANDARIIEAQRSHEAALEALKQEHFDSIEQLTVHKLASNLVGDRRLREKEAEIESWTLRLSEAQQETLSVRAELEEAVRDAQAREQEAGLLYAEQALQLESSCARAEELELALTALQSSLQASHSSLVEAETRLESMETQKAHEVAQVETRAAAEFAAWKGGMEAQLAAQEQRTLALDAALAALTSEAAAQSLSASDAAASAAATEQSLRTQITSLESLLEQSLSEVKSLQIQVRQTRCDDEGASAELVRARIAAEDARARFEQERQEWAARVAHERDQAVEAARAHDEALASLAAASAAAAAERDAASLVRTEALEAALALARKEASESSAGAREAAREAARVLAHQTHSAALALAEIEARASREADSLRQELLETLARAERAESGATQTALRGLQMQHDDALRQLRDKHAEAIVDLSRQMATERFELQSRLDQARFALEKLTKESRAMESQRGEAESRAHAQLLATQLELERQKGEVERVRTDAERVGAEWDAARQRWEHTRASMASRTAEEVGAARQEASQLRAELAELARTHAGQVAALEEEHTRTHASLTLAAERSAAEAAASRLAEAESQRKLHACETALEHVRAAALSGDAERASSHARALAALQNKLETARHELADERANHERARAENEAEHAAALAQAQRHLDDARLETQAARVETQRAEVGAQLARDALAQRAAMEPELDALRAGATEDRERIGSLSNELDAAMTRCVALEQQLAAAHEAHQAVLFDAQQSSDLSLGILESEIASLEAEALRAREERADIEGALERARGEKEEMEDRAARAVELARDREQIVMQILPHLLGMAQAQTQGQTQGQNQGPVQNTLGMAQLQLLQKAAASLGQTPLAPTQQQRGLAAPFTPTAAGSGTTPTASALGDSCAATPLAAPHTPLHSLSHIARPNHDHDREEEFEFQQAERDAGGDGETAAGQVRPVPASFFEACASSDEEEEEEQVYMDSIAEAEERERESIDATLLLQTPVPHPHSSSPFSLQSTPDVRAMIRLQLGASGGIGGNNYMLPRTELRLGRGALAAAAATEASGHDDPRAGLHSRAESCVSDATSTMGSLFDAPQTLAALHSLAAQMHQSSSQHFSFSNSTAAGGNSGNNKQTANADEALVAANSLAATRAQELDSLGAAHAHLRKMHEHTLNILQEEERKRVQVETQLRAARDQIAEIQAQERERAQAQEQAQEQAAASAANAAAASRAAAASLLPPALAATLAVMRSPAPAPPSYSTTVTPAASALGSGAGADGTAAGVPGAETLPPVTAGAPALHAALVALHAAASKQESQLRTHVSHISSQYNALAVRFDRVRTKYASLKQEKRALRDRAREVELQLKSQLAQARSAADGAAALEEALRNAHAEEVAALRSTISGAEESARHKLTLALQQQRSMHDAIVAHVRQTHATELAKLRAHQLQASAPGQEHVGAAQAQTQSHATQVAALEAEITRLRSSLSEHSHRLTLATKEASASASLASTLQARLSIVEAASARRNEEQKREVGALRAEQNAALRAEVRRSLVVNGNGAASPMSSSLRGGAGAHLSPTNSSSSSSSRSSRCAVAPAPAPAPVPSAATPVAAGAGTAGAGAGTGASLAHRASSGALTGGPPTPVHQRPLVVAAAPTPAPATLAPAAAPSPPLPDFSAKAQLHATEIDALLLKQVAPLLSPTHSLEPTQSQSHSRSQSQSQSQSRLVSAPRTPSHRSSQPHSQRVSARQSSAELVRSEELLMQPFVATPH